ncbi:MAG: hypothetical protein ACFFC7_29415 [Candidatus Hermodarchaeota archaeon]
MTSRKILAFLVLSLFIMMTISSQGTMAISKAPTTGTTTYLEWSYDEDKTHTRSESASLSESASYSETQTHSREITQNVPLIESINSHQVWYFRYINKSKADPKDYWVKENGWGRWKAYPNTTTDGIFNGAWVRYAHYDGVWNDFAMAFWGLREKWVGANWEADAASVTVVNDTNVVDKLDWLGLNYGTEQHKAYYVQYNDTSLDEVVFEELLIPAFVEVKVIVKNYQVSIKESVDSSVDLAGSYNFTGNYDLTRNGVEVRINDGSNLAFGYFADRDVSVDYFFKGGFTVSGGLSLNRSVDMKYTSNDSSVEQWRRPIWWQDLTFVTKGRWSTKWNETGNLFAIGVLQSIIQGMLTRKSEETEPNLAIWGNLNPGYILSYVDTDGDGLLGAVLNGSEITTADTLRALGIPGGYNLVGNYNYSDAIDAIVYTKIGDTTLLDIDEDASHYISKDFNISGSYNPLSANITQPSLDFEWETPVEDADGKTTFEWTVTYDGMPVSWVTDNGTVTKIYRADESAATDYAMDFTYNYEYVVDPQNGEATLTTNYIQSGITDSDLLKDLEDTSMATWKRDYFLTMTVVSDDAGSGFSNDTMTIEQKIGDTTKFIDQEFGGSKATYTQGTNNYQAKTSTINLISGKGETHDPEANITDMNPYVSAVSRRVADVLMKYTASDLSGYLPNIAWHGRENIVITSYPTWDPSEQLVHDPTFSAFYSPVERNYTTSTSTKTPGFAFTVSLLALGVGAAIIAIYSRRKRR